MPGLCRLDVGSDEPGIEARWSHLGRTRRVVRSARSLSRSSLDFRIWRARWRDYVGGLQPSWPVGLEQCALLAACGL